ncbi:hypothetical protein [Aquimarina mytili]|uniref:DNA primase n=1 Tax=Aquimarina mytili TaxID=874423 RepID=A0A936ZZN6_9FLAO|nr:hypothetical protein [Aquimarina mytili]MBL0684923.1 hypothetical protein [Aquimarina mytili]
MRRVIVDYKKLNRNILNLLVEKFPDGYADRDIISFKNHHNEAIEAVEVKTPDTIYLVKISKRLADSMQSFENPTMEVPTGVSKEDVGEIEDK